MSTDVRMLTSVVAVSHTVEGGWMSPSRTVPTGVQFVLLALAWGTSFLFIKVGLEGLSPGQVVLVRLVIGAVTLLAICAVTRNAGPRQPLVWLHLLVVALLLCDVPFMLYSWAEQYLSSGLASIYNATTPLMTLAVSMVALPEESRTPRRFIGLLLGFAGVVVLMAPWSMTISGGAWGQLACLAGTACYGMGFTWLRKFVTPFGLPAVSVACVQIIMGAMVMLVASPVVATAPVHVTWHVVVSMLALGTLSSGFAYVWNTNVVMRWGAANASAVTYLILVVGVVLGVLFLGEHLTWTEPLGAMVVLVGIAVSQGRIKLARRGDSWIGPRNRPRA